MVKNGIFIGLTTIDIQYLIDTFPGANVKVKTDAPDVMVGGPATNAAVIFAHLNGNAELYSAIGINPFRNYILDDLTKHKIRVNDVVDGQPVSPVIATVVTSDEKGDRNIFTHNPPKININSAILNQFENREASFIFIDGFYPEIALPVLKAAKKKNIPVIADCGSWKPQYEDLLPFVDYAICSNDFQPPGTLNSLEVFEYLASKNIQNAAITRGGDSILWHSEKGINEIDVECVIVVDTLGAGDFFHGAFCHYLLNLKNFELALKAASHIAGISCGYSGTRTWLKYVK